MSAQRQLVTERRAHGRRSGGFTLLELMVTLTLLAILTVIALPSFNDAFLSSRLSSFSNTFTAAVQLARSEAIKRNSRVVMCRSSDGSSCLTSGGWEAGWIAFADSDGDGSFDSGETRVLYQAALSTDYSLAPTVTIPSLVFNGTGMLESSSSAAEVIFELRRTNPSSIQHREIRVATSGRTKLRVCRNEVCT